MPDLKVFLAAPSDTNAEAVVEKKVMSISKKLKDVRAPGYEFHHWSELDPALHAMGAQGLIDEKIDCTKADLVIGVFANKFGAAVVNGLTPTEHEIRRAHDSFMATGKPQIALYFLEGQTAPNTADEAAQLAAVRRFEDEFRGKGITGRYRDTEDLGDAVDSRLWSFASPYWGQTGDARPERLHYTLACQPNILPSNGVTALLGDVEVSVAKREQKGPATFHDFFIYTSPAVNVTSRRMQMDDHIASEARLVNGVDGTAYSGLPIGENILLFQKVRLDCGSAKLRLTGIRANASQVNVAAGCQENISVFVFERESGSGESPKASSIQGVVAGTVVWRLFHPSFPNCPAYAAGDSVIPQIIVNGASSVEIVLRINEAWPRAFEAAPNEQLVHMLKPRFLIRVRDILPRWRVFVSSQGVSRHGQNSVPKATLIRAAADGSGASLIGSERDADQLDSPVTELSLVAGIGAATWEWNGYRHEKDSIESFDVAVTFSCPAGELSACRIGLDVQIAPVSSVATASSRASMPRYVEDTLLNFHVRFSVENLTADRP